MRGVQAGWDDTEADFWRVVESGEEPVEVLRAAGLDTANTGSGFPQVLVPNVTHRTLHCAQVCAVARYK